MKRCILSAALFFSVFATANAATTALPTSTTTTPVGFSLHATVSAKAGTSEHPFSLATDITVEGRDRDSRLDVSSPNIANTVTTPHFITLLYHAATKQATIFSEQTHRYYTFTPSQLPFPKPIAGTSPASSFSFFHFLSGLKTDKERSLTIALAGHGTTNGHPTTGVSIVYHHINQNDAVTHVHGTLQLADDLDAFPVQALFTVDGFNTLPTIDVAMNVVSIDKHIPPASDFLIPAGYVQTSTFTDVLGIRTPVLTP